MSLIDVFVTGTDTGVGKTHVAALYAGRQLAKGRRPGYCKPAQTGGDDDARTVAERAPGTVCATVYRYVAPLAPAVAARLEHAPPVSIDHVLEAVEQLSADVDGVIVEGSGGLLVPLGERTTFADLAVALALPVVIVTRPGLGALNHTALTVEAARRRGLEVAGIVVNGCARRPDLAERTNRAELGRIAPVIESVALATEVRA